jgi:SSS family transporter
MNVTHTIIIMLFMVMLMVAGLLISRGVKSSKDWMIAGGTLGVIPLVGTYFATIISAASIVSYAGYYYFNGWSGWWNCAGTFLTSFLGALYYAKRLKNVSRNTLPDFIEDRYGSKQAAAAAILILIGTTCLTAAQVIGGSIILQTATGFSNVTCVILITFIFIIFTAVGGMKAVAWSDTICAIVIIVGVWIEAFTLLDKVGGFGALNESLYKINPSMLEPFSAKIPPLTALSWVVTWGLGNFGAPQFITRFFAAKSPEHAQKSQAYTGIALMAFYLPLMLTGLCGAVILPGIAKQDMVNPTLIANYLSPISGGILLAAIMAACISTADSLLLLCGTTFTNDLYCKFINKNADDKTILKVSRVTTLIVGILAVAGSFIINDAMMWIQAKTVTMVSSATCVLVLAGLVWKRANAAGGTACMVVGFLTACIWYALGQPFGMMPLLPAVITGFIGLFISLCEEKNRLNSENN